MNKSVRNIFIFAIVTLGCGFLGNAVNSLYNPPDPMQSLGVLIWLVSPLAANLVLRSLGKDGWGDFGIVPHFKSGWRWYLLSLTLVPLISLILIGIGNLTGAVRTSSPLSSPGWNTILSLLGVGLASTMVKNLFEEFAWRGYLTPRFEALKINPVLNSLFTGLIWAGWHIPYYLFFLSPAVIKTQTFLPVPVLILTAFIILPIQALAYGELRLLSKSTWTAWLMHSVANGISFALMTGGFVPLSHDLSSLILTPTTEGIVYSLLLALTGWGLYQVRKRAG